MTLDLIIKSHVVPVYNIGIVKQMSGINEALGGNNAMMGMAKDIVMNKAEDYFKNIKVDSYASRIFSPEIRAYFDVDTDTVRNKLVKLLAPFKTFSFDDSVRKLELYLPIVSFMTLIMFSTLLEGLESKDFTPKIGKRALWLLIFTMIEVLLAKFTENAVSNLNLSIIELISLVSYRFVSLSAVAIVLVITGMAFPPLRYLGVVYALVVDTFFCKLELENCSRDRFKEEGGLGNKLALGVHILTTLVIMWYCSIL